MYLPDAYGADGGGPDDGAAGEHEPVRDPRSAEPPRHVRLRPQEADRAVHRTLLERELRPDLPDPEPARRRGPRRAPAGEAARQAGSSCLLAHPEGPSGARAVARPPRQARARAVRAAAEALPRPRRPRGEQRRPDRARPDTSPGAPRHLRRDRAAAPEGHARAPGASVLPHPAPLRTAPESGDARVVRRNPRHAQPTGRARGAPHRSRLGGHHGVTDRRHPSRPRRGGNARALRGADPDAYREGRRVPPPLGQGLLLGDGGGRGNGDRARGLEAGGVPRPPRRVPLLLGLLRLTGLTP